MFEEDNQKHIKRSFTTVLWNESSSASIGFNDLNILVASVL
jgi:hypothetical protein